MSKTTKLQYRALMAMMAQYDFIDVLKDCGDANDNPQYFTDQVNQLRGMREMFEAVFGHAPYSKAATQAMIDDLF